MPTEALRDAPPAASECLQFEGRLLKESRKGAWQARYFRVSNGFLLYYRREGDARPACSLALRDVLQVERLDELTFRLAFTDGTTYMLRAAYQRLVESWVSAIESHVRWCKAAGGQGPMGSPSRSGGGNARAGSTSNFAAAGAAAATTAAAASGMKSPGVVSPATAASSGGTPGASLASPTGSEARTTTSHGSVIGVRSSTGRGDSAPDSDDDVPRGSSRSSRARDPDSDHDDWYPRSAGPRSPAVASGGASGTAGSGSSVVAVAAPAGDAVQTRGSRANSAAMAAPAVVGHAITTAAATALAGATGLIRGVTTTVTSTITGLASGTGAAHDASATTATGTRPSGAAPGTAAANNIGARGAPPPAPVLPPWLRLYARMAEEAAEEGTGSADEVCSLVARASDSHFSCMPLALRCASTLLLLLLWVPSPLCRWSWRGLPTRACGWSRTSGRRRKRRAALTAMPTSARGRIQMAQLRALMPPLVPSS